MKRARILFALLAPLLLAACEAVLFTTAVVTAVDVSIDRRTPGRYLDDNRLELKLRGVFSSDEALDGVNISVTVLNGIVLLTGETHSDAQRRRAEELAQEHPEARKVVNELQLSGATNLPSRVNDAWITGKVKARLLNVRNFPDSAGQGGDRARQGVFARAGQPRGRRHRHRRDAPRARHHAHHHGV